jgi:tryptophanyl-tRNA synthetase
MHKIFTPQDEVENINRECRRAGIGCVDCKRIFARHLNKHLEPFREKRAELARDPKMVWDILDDGQKRASLIARETIREVKQAIGLPLPDQPD